MMSANANGTFVRAPRDAVIVGRGQNAALHRSLDLGLHQGDQLLRLLPFVTAVSCPSCRSDSSAVTLPLRLTLCSMAGKGGAPSRAVPHKCGFVNGILHRG